MWRRPAHAGGCAAARQPGSIRPGPPAEWASAGRASPGPTSCRVRVITTTTPRPGTGPGGSESSPRAPPGRPGSMVTVALRHAAPELSSRPPELVTGSTRPSRLARCYFFRVPGLASSDRRQRSGAGTSSSLSRRPTRAGLFKLPGSCCPMRRRSTPSAIRDAAPPSAEPQRRPLSEQNNHDCLQTRTRSSVDDSRKKVLWTRD